MKSFLISIRAEWCSKIFNGEKTREIRRTAPKEWADYLSGKTSKKPEPMVGYIYCTNDKTNILERNTAEPFDFFVLNNRKHLVFKLDKKHKGYNAKVIAKFTLMEVERIMYLPLSLGLDERHKHKCYSCVFEDRHKEGFNQENYSDYFTEGSDDNYLVYYSKMKASQIHEYLKGGKGYAWHISDLVIFDKAKELGEFKHPYLSCGRYCGNNFVPSFCRLHCSHNTDPERLNVWCDRNDKWGEPITKAPQSWCYAEERK